MAFGKYFLARTAGSPKRMADSFILPSRVANHNVEFNPSCSLTEVAV